MLIIPAIDLYNGECVRLYQGEEEQRTVFSSDPLKVALRWQAAGAKLLHVVDLNGAFEGRSRNLKLIRKMADALSIPVQLGGGIRSEAQVAQVLSYGISRVVLGTIALESPGLVKRMCSAFPQRIAVGIDARDKMVVSRGWRESSSILATCLAKAAIIFTDTGRDGTLTGPNLESLQAMACATSIPLIASGGIASLEDIGSIVQRLPQIEGVITGMAIYTGRIDLSQAIHLYQTEG
jgi:phosphoribosylformimino-5-aminoimidazole carboxamide ribotide isomerase